MDSMNRRTFLSTLAMFAAGTAGATAAAAARVRIPGTPPAEDAGEQLSVPDWMQVDRDASTVTMEIVAGETDANNHWNFNGFTSGEARIVVPEGFDVEIQFRNDDPNMAHSLGIDEARDSWPAMISNPEPVFDGAITSSPTAMARATQPGDSETISFTADTAGEYAMVCYIPGHAAVGMWTDFAVSADGEAGVSTA